MYARHGPTHRYADLSSTAPPLLACIVKREPLLITGTSLSIYEPGPNEVALLYHCVCQCVYVLTDDNERGH
jgi:hypothetical protein